MNPELPKVPQSTEVAPQVTGAVEYVPERPDQNPEIQKPAEQAPAPSPEAQYQGIPATLPVVTVTPPAPVADDTNSSVAADDDTPLVAADDDLIEKEWVDKLKKIIALTKDDPYERNKVIAQLQADYLKKRYNKVLGQSKEE